MSWADNKETSNIIKSMRCLFHELQSFFFFTLTTVHILLKLSKLRKTSQHNKFSSKLWREHQTHLWLLNFLHKTRKWETKNTVIINSKSSRFSRWWVPIARKIQHSFAVCQRFSIVLGVFEGHIISRIEEEFLTIITISSDWDPQQFFNIFKSGENCHQL